MYLRLFPSFILIFSIFLFTNIGLSASIDTPITQQALSKVKDQAIQEGFWSNSDALILKHQRALTAQSDGTTKLKIYVCGVVFDEKAANDYSQIAILYNSYYEDIHLEYAHSIQETGDIIEVSRDAIQIKTLPEFSGTKRYSDSKLFTFSLPALQPGACFEFLIIRDIKPVVPNYWVRSMPFSFKLLSQSPMMSPRIDPVFNSTVKVKTPADQPFSYIPDQCNPQPVIEKMKKGTCYTWKMKKVPKLVYEKHMPNEDYFRPSIECSSITNWAEVDKWAYQRFVPNAIPDEAIRRKVIELTSGLADPDAKIKAIFDYIQKNVEYIGTDLGRGGYVPHGAEVVFKNKYGDCKDQTVLFMAMLKSLGIDARPALLNTFPRREVLKKIPSPYFNHVIVYIPGTQKELWLDTVAMNPFPALLWANQGRSAFIVNGKGGRFKTTPKECIDSNRAEMNFHYTLKDQILAVEMEINATGAVSDIIKGTFRNITEEKRKAFIRDWLKKMNPSIEPKSVEFSDLSDPDRPLFIHASCKFSQTISDTVTQLPFSFTFLVPLTFFTALNPLPSPLDRKTDFVVGYGCTIKGKWTYSADNENFVVFQLPDLESMDTAYVSFQEQVLEQKNSVKATAELILKKDHIPIHHYNEFYNDIQKVIKRGTKTITLGRKKVDHDALVLEAQLNNAPDSHENMLALAKHYLKIGKYEDAQKLLEQASTLNQESGEIHYFLGVALGYNNEMEAAQKEFETAGRLGFMP